MSTKLFGIYKSSSSLQIKEIEENSDYKRFSNVVEVESGPGKNGNGIYYIRIFSQGEFKELSSGKWKINPLIQCGYDWRAIDGSIDVTDVNNKQHTCHILVDWRTIYKRDVNDGTDIRSIFRFIDSLKEYVNLEHYLLSLKIKDILEKKWQYSHDNLSNEEYSEATKYIKEVDKEYILLENSIKNQEDLLLFNNMEDNYSQLHERYNEFVPEQETTNKEHATD